MTPIGTQGVAMHKQPLSALIMPKGTLSHNLLSTHQVCSELGAKYEQNAEIASYTFPNGKQVYSKVDAAGTHDFALDVIKEAHSTALPGTRAYLAMRYESIQERVNVFHATMGSPTWDTLAHCIKTFGLRVPGLTTKQILDHPVYSIATAQGHLDQARPYHRKEEEPQNDLPTPLSPTSPPPTSTKHRAIDVALWDTVEKEKGGIVFADATGQLKEIAVDGSRYLLIFYAQDKDYVHLETLKSTGHEDYIMAYKNATRFFIEHGCPAIEYRFDNQTSEPLEEYLRTQGLTFQKFPPGQHRANIAERIIRYVKNHIISSLSTTDKNFPIALWCYCVPQWEITMNLLRQGSHPQISAYEDMMGKRFNWEAHPIFPTGTKVLVHDKPEKRGSWDPHGVVGYYLGPCMDGYRTYNVWIESTHKTRRTDTVAWFSDRFKIAAIDSAEHLAMATAQVGEALTRIVDEMQLGEDKKHEFIVYRDECLSSLKSINLLLAPHDSTYRQQLEAEEHAYAERVDEIMRKREEEEASATAQRVAIEAAEAQRVHEEEAEAAKQAEELAKTCAAARAASLLQRQTNNKAAREQDQLIFTPPLNNPPALIDTAWAEAISKQRRANERSKRTIQEKAQKDNEAAATRHERSVAALRAAPSPTRQSSRQHQRYNWNVKANNGRQSTRTTLQALCSLYAKRAKEKEREEHTLLLAYSAQFKAAIKSADKVFWLKAAEEEMVRLVEDTKTMHAVIDEGQSALYYNPQIKLKADAKGNLVYRVRGTAGGNISTYDGLTAAKCASMPTVKILLNSVISDHAKDKQTKFMCLDIKDFYLMSELDGPPQYLRVKVSQIGPEAMERLDLAPFVKNDAVLFRLVKGIYGLPEAGRLAQKKLIAHLAANGYEQCSTDSPCLFQNKEKTITFSLVVDDFGVKYRNKADVEALIACLAKGEYKMSQDWTGSKYLGFEIAWNYDKHYVDLSLPGHIKDLVDKLNITNSFKYTAAPGVYTPPSYGNKGQFTKIDESRPLDAIELLYVQRIVGSLLYYSRAVDPTMLTAINKISTMKPTLDALNATKHLLNYARSHDKCLLRFKASDMKLVTYSDGSYLGDSKSRSRQGGIHFMGYNNEPESTNGAVECISSLIRVIVASAAECEYGALYENAVTAEGLRTTLEDLGYAQGSTTIYCDNTVAVGLANDEVKEKRTKAIDKDFHWVRCRVKQGHFTVQYKKGKDNLADIFTKLLSPTEHQRVVPSLVHYGNAAIRRAASRRHLQGTKSRTQH